MPLFDSSGTIPGRLLLQGAVGGVIAGAGPTVDWDPSGQWAAGEFSTIMINADAALGPIHTISGLAGGVDGRIAVLHLNSVAAGVVLALAHAQSSSQNANRILLPGGVNFNFALFGAVVLRYDGAAQRWRYVSS